MINNIPDSAELKHTLELSEASSHRQASRSHSIGNHEDQVPLANSRWFLIMVLCSLMLRHSCQDDDSSSGYNSPNKETQFAPEGICTSAVARDLALTAQQCCIFICSAFFGMNRGVSSVGCKQRLSGRHLEEKDWRGARSG